jgi:hypothetical protein
MSTIVDAASGQALDIVDGRDSAAADQMVTRVQQRLDRDREQRGGRKIDPAWANRTPLRGYNTLSARAGTPFEQVFATDDTTGELLAAGCQGAAPAAPRRQHGRAGPHREDDLGDS